jgi:hypothetical protein
MTAPVVTPRSPAPVVRPPHRLQWIAGVLLAAVVVAVTYAVISGGSLRPVPSFPSLQASPDPSLHGTVAYVDDRSRCVTLIAASGAASKQLWCLPDLDVEKAVALGKEQGPQLRWRSDGLLEVTMFRMTKPPGPTYNAGWQKLVDPRTGAVTDSPDAPSTLDTSGQPSVNARGDRITTSSDDATGRIRITVTGSDGRSRTLLSLQGPGKYTYRLTSAFWAPDGSWIAADDGRILVITPGEPPVTRVLTDATTMGGFDGPRFAVTSADLLPGAQS